MLTQFHHAIRQLYDMDGVACLTIFYINLNDERNKPFDNTDVRG